MSRLTDWITYPRAELSAIDRRISQVTKIAFAMIGLGAIMALVPLFANHQSLANIGSWLQGVGSFWSLASFLLIYVAFLSQKQQSIAQEHQIGEQRQQFESQLALQRQELEMMRNEATERINGILRAIRYELETVSLFYMETSGRLLGKVKDGEPYMTYFLLNQDYFIVYPNNTDVVGRITDKDLCKAIVTTYNVANFLLECFHINNAYLDRLREFARLQAQHPLDHYIDTNLKAIHQQLVEAARQLKRVEAELKRQTDSLMVKIDDYLSVSS